MNYRVKVFRRPAGCGVDTKNCANGAFISVLGGVAPSGSGAIGRLRRFATRRLNRRKPYVFLMLATRDRRVHMATIIDKFGITYTVGRNARQF
jgi:hypothetical protein